MELDVFHLNKLVAALLARHLEKLLVVQAELKFGHASQGRLHLDGTEDLAAQDGSVGRDEDVQLLDDVKEHLVLGMLDAFRAPTNGVTRGRGHVERADVSGARILLHTAKRILFLLHFVGFGLDVLLQHLDLGDLRVAMIHHLVEQLVCDDEVVAQALILELLKVADEAVTNLVEERQHHGDVWVTLGHAHHVDVVHLDPNVCDVLLGEDGFEQSLFLLEDLALELVSNGRCALTAVIARYDNLTLLVKEVNG